MYTNPQTNEAISLKDVLIELPKEVLVERLNYCILEDPLKEGIKGWRALEVYLQKAMNANDGPQDIAVSADPLINYINLMFDLHEIIEENLPRIDFGKAKEKVRKQG